MELMKRKCANCNHYEPPNNKKMEFTGWCGKFKEVVSYQDSVCTGWLEESKQPII